jgi:MoaA/NifB/PqqE/SkfB family radical SAM enzyme
MDFHPAPFIVIWETTQACDLACVHCRAKAQPLPPPGELSHEEGLALLDEMAEMGAKVSVLSGGDPLKRADLLDLIRHGKSRCAASHPDQQRHEPAQLRRRGSAH